MIAAAAGRHREAPRFAYPHDDLCDPAAAGIDPRALRAVASELAAQQRAGAFPGGQIAVRRHGKLVLDEAFGLASGHLPAEPRRHARPDTLFPVFSAGKPLTALCIALLEERGQLDVHAPIAETIPEFGVRGKQAITTLDVLTHTGGILMPEFCRRWREWGDWNKVVDAICAATPSLPRGTLAYHPLEYGWVLGEIVRRVSGRALDRFLDDELLGPAGLDGMRFSLPRSRHDEVARAYWLGGPRANIGPVNVAAMFTEIAREPEVLLGALVPGAGLLADAAHLAALYDLLAAGTVTREGRGLLRRSTLRRYTERHVYGFCRSNRAPLAMARGFIVGTAGPCAYGWWGSSGCYGHAGAFCTIAFADAETDLAVAVVTNGNRGALDLVRRFPGLLQRLRGSVIRRRRRIFS